MSYLKFDKALLMNLEKSLTKELIRTNRAGAYSSSTLIECNTRKHHGQLIVPLPELDGGNHILLSSLDETIIQHGAEFNLGIHNYSNNHFNPNGHRYLREFSSDSIPKSVYRVGGVVLQKERLLVSNEPRVLFKYTLLDAHSPTIIRLKPFLAFRNVNSLTYENSQANSNYEEVQNGVSMRLYDGYPKLNMQFDRANEYLHQPVWNKGIEYYKERERGFECREDLLVSGYFELSIKKGDAIIFSAGTTEVDPKTLSELWDREMKRRNRRIDFFSTLKNAAQQFYKKESDKTYILAGYHWFGARARDQFVSLVPNTLMIDREDYFDEIMQTSIAEINAFLNGDVKSAKLEGIDEPDVLLWFIRVVQQFAERYSLEDAAKKYLTISNDIIDFIKKQKHGNLFLQNNNLLFVNGTERPATWMNAVEDGRPIVPRTGFVVEINALWYNALKFVSQLNELAGNQHLANLLDYQAGIAKTSFMETFWNGTYLYDFVINSYKDVEVRPNMIIAAGLPFSPLDRNAKKSVLQIVTKELLTPKGLRTLSPKSGSYRPEYVGGMKERNWNYHSGPVWPWLIGYFADAYLEIYKESGISFVERILTGLEAEMSELCIGTLSELYDGNPPFKGHGGVSFAMNIAETIRVYRILEKLKKEVEQ